MGHPSRSLEDSGAESDVLVHGELAQEVSKGSHISNCTRKHFVLFLVKNVSAFCLHSKNSRG